MILVPRRLPPIVVGLIGLILVTSLVAAVTAHAGVDLYQWLALVPAQVWSGQLWRLATWTLVESSPWALVFAAVTIYWFGGDLVEAWGGPPFARFVVAVVAVASVGTTAIGLALPAAWQVAHLGGWALGDALVIAWALQFPARRIRVYGLVAVGGEVLAYGTFAITVLFAVFDGAVPYLPELIAGGAALLYRTGALRRWRATVARRFRRRHLRAVPDPARGPRWN